MQISGLVVCVDYADYLEESLYLWKSGLDRLTVVTVSRDEATLRLCREQGVGTFETDAFYRDGCPFNKAAALNEAVEAVPWRDWILCFDADVVPPPDWRKHCEDLLPGFLYGCPRQDDRGRVLPEGEMPSYFHLFHSDDPHVQRRPLFDASWRHAGGYDSEFQFRWKERKRWLPFSVTHLGRPGLNWFGRDNQEAALEMHAERRRTGTIASFERMDGRTEGWLECQD